MSEIKNTFAQINIHDPAIVDAFLEDGERDVKVQNHLNGGEGIMDELNNIKNVYNVINNTTFLMISAPIASPAMTREENQRKYEFEGVCEILQVDVRDVTYAEVYNSSGLGQETETFISAHAKACSKIVTILNDIKKIVFKNQTWKAMIINGENFSKYISLSICVNKIIFIRAHFCVIKQNLENIVEIMGKSPKRVTYSLTNNISHDDICYYNVNMLIIVTTYIIVHYVLIFYGLRSPS